MSATSLTLDAGQTAQLSATVKDQYGAVMTGKTVTWTSSDATVASVSSTGLVTAVTPGQANITATHQSLSATASVTANDGVDPEVTMFLYDGFEVTFEPGVLELYGPTQIGVTVQDDYQLDSIAVYLHTDGVDVELSRDETLSGTLGTYFFNWNTYETTTVGGVDTLWANVWDTSGNVGEAGQEIVLMNQPVITVNNLLQLPLTVTYKDQDGVDYVGADTVAVADSLSKRKAFMSTDSIQLRWEVQRTLVPGHTSTYLGVAASGLFSAEDMTTNWTYEVDNVVGDKTYYMPRWSSAESNTAEAAPVVDLGLTSEINICYVSFAYRCAVAPGASSQDYGYYELSTTSRVGYRQRSGSWHTGGWYWVYSSFADDVADGSGIVVGDFPVTFSSSQAQLQRSAAQAGPNPRRIPGAITDDRPRSDLR
tara:strand:- start:2738 stop:4006 length:1269 start_codon:yes stop_codon:yes gene_type:complete